jgi:hypothetical protein
LCVAVAIGCVLIAALTGSAVRAEPKPAPTPWSRGVPEVSQQRALKLFREGNVFFEQSKYTEAVAIYEQALTAWDHPNIRFNMAICLVNMRQPLVAWNHLQQALRFGDAPLGKRLYTEGMTYVGMLDSTLAQLTVKSVQPGIRVMLDGTQALDGPGEHVTKLLAGKHQLVASKPGFITESRALDLAAGKPAIEQIELKPEKIQVQVEVQRENYDRRWRWWVPWSVAGGSVVLGVVASAIYVGARTEMRRYDREFLALCDSGCAEGTIPPELEARKANARRNSGVAIGMWSVAGAMAITGAVMAVLNRPYKQESRGIARTVAPSVAVAPDYVGVGLTVALE